ncbi:Cytosolic endo-beta-N-acetylglucosaminidase [Eumeta japonica]|uniref:Cytosolic endo-beta-N-acetylglucosaminidase n=1 Tax=Eumeta variegata TaxID=151549 RepID=A0A4C1VED6_EUMVA|nr:Cytosolic endo-beta-N-acetylglucosaminidase [Eumeta japonica]
MNPRSSQKLLDSYSSLTCQPIRTYKELLEFVENPPSWRSLCVELKPHSTYVIKNVEIHNNPANFSNSSKSRFYCHFDTEEQQVQVKHHEEQKVAKTLVCHDMANGYHDDSYIDGTVNYDAYNFYNWGGIDVFCYFSHHFVTVPPLCWINVAHMHGVKVIGTVITEWKAGAAFWESVLSAESEWRRFASALLAVAKCLRLDGWLLNVENEISRPDALLAFVKELAQLQRAQNCPMAGCLFAFFDACDGIFTNYSWKEADVRASAEEAGARLRDVYIGIDVWGRNFYGGGKFNTKQAIEVAHRYGCSLAIFAPAWTHEDLPTKVDDNIVQRYSEFLVRDRALWGSLWPYLNTKLPCHLPFRTNFCRGQGLKRRLYGEVLCPGPWYNMRHMQYQPNSAHGPHEYELVSKLVKIEEVSAQCKDDKENKEEKQKETWTLSVSLVMIPEERPCYELCLNDSFTGGSCLRVNPSPEGECVSLLFQCDFRWRHALLVCVVTKVGPIDIWLYSRGSLGERRYVLAEASRVTAGLSLPGTEQLAPLEGSALIDARRQLLLEEPDSYVPQHNAYGWTIRYYALDANAEEMALTRVGCSSIEGPALLGYLGFSEIQLSFFSPCERGGEGGEKPIMDRPCARAHRCVRLSQTKNLLNNVNLQWREQNAITPSFKTRPYDMEMPSARDCPMGDLRVAPRHRRSREAYSTDCMLRGDSGGAGSAPD